MPLNRLSSQRGLSLMGLLVVASLVALVVFIAVRVTPAMTEYFEIKRAVERSAKAGATPAEIRAAFDNNKAAGYIESLSGNDLEISRDNNGRFEVSFAYEKRIALGGPVYLLIEYAGAAKGNAP
jgi:hypothetical protein